MIGLIAVILFLSCGVTSAFDLFGDELDYEDIYLDEDLYLTTSFDNESSERPDGDMYYSYNYL